MRWLIPIVISFTHLIQQIVNVSLWKLSISWKTLTTAVHERQGKTTTHNLLIMIVIEISIETVKLFSVIKLKYQQRLQVKQIVS